MAGGAVLVGHPPKGEPGEGGQAGGGSPCLAAAAAEEPGGGGGSFGLGGDILCSNGSLGGGTCSVEGGSF